MDMPLNSCSDLDQLAAVRIQQTILVGPVQLCIREGKDEGNGIKKNRPPAGR